MSRGLGRLQREILAAMDADHEAEFVTIDRRPIYDLYAIKATLAQRGYGRLCRVWVPRIPEMYIWTSGAFTASFSRAIKTLLARGLVQRHELPTQAQGMTFAHTHFVSRTPISVK